MLIANNDDAEIFEWILNANQFGGGFVSSVASAALRADDENYALIRPLVLQLREKYPDYNPKQGAEHA